ncbi:uncharacterized protein N7496_012543 [Penicillium cataractarum]|uniref:Xylanolytic transcriptional activator regulatory domain-containing protein n=1 Tax=Penicillium cataractarum TaxID=2100454 RepID=A0A9W9UUL3_9EURO|nr:uncharacterized protein N7496_012543 [Penicillium cataractarum]KAJ5355331.1 hypothetical protein N7496_012543 [Penicillium cataractarum]
MASIKAKMAGPDKLHLEKPHTVPSSLDKEVYPLHWRPASVEDPPDIGGLPSLDDALYLFETVKHHLDQHYRFFNEDCFTQHLHEFYSTNSLQKATENGLWFVQFLLVLAFGNAFLLRTRSARDPPGSRFFVRAMSLLPDHTTIWKDGILAVEVLALAALYLYSIDHREAAHVYVGQAIRIAQLDGLHTELPEDELGIQTVARCRNLWWTLYVMDRHISSSLGLPFMTQDSDITTALKPGIPGSRHDTTLSLHVKLSYLFSTILTSDEKCVLVATRPLLLSVLKERLDRLGGREDDWQSFLAPTKALISTGIKSALKTLQILADENSQLEVFLPFEMEVTYGAAIHLLIANSLFPKATDKDNFIEEAHNVLDEMIFKGNRLATARKTELAHLEGLFAELTVRVEQYGLQTLSLATPEQLHSNVEGQPSHMQVLHTEGHRQFDLGGIPNCLDTSPSMPNLAGGVELLDDIGISSYEFLSIIDQIGGTERSILDSRAS